MWFVSKGIVFIFFYFFDIYNVFCMGNLIVNFFYLYIKRGEDCKLVGWILVLYGMKSDIRFCVIGNWKVVGLSFIVDI